MIKCLFKLWLYDQLCMCIIFFLFFKKKVINFLSGVDSGGVHLGNTERPL